MNHYSVHTPVNFLVKEFSLEYSLKGLMLKLKLQYFDYLMWRTDSLEKTLMLGKTEGEKRTGLRGWGGCMASLTHWTGVWANAGRQWRTGKPGALQFMGSQSDMIEQLSNNMEAAFCSRNSGVSEDRRLDDTSLVSDVSFPNSHAQNCIPQYLLKES